MPRNDFREVEIIRDPDGVVAIVSERKATGHVSFMIGREFDRAGDICRSSFLARRHIAGARRLLDALEDRLDVIEDRSRTERRAAQ
ncbi:MAG: hypothetical protein KJO40_13730 [Deltaproteobacteria bacterium]|nr:hypothetical protein [Deltaproteobacteria bacterium]